MTIWTLRATGGSAADIDRDAVRSALSVLAAPSEWIQVRHNPTWRHRNVRGNDPDGFWAAVADYADGKGVYVSLNPLPGPLENAAKAKDFSSRRWLVIDCDPVRPDADSNSTDSEKEAARQTADHVLEWLLGQGWPAPLLLDSGNGWHLLYRTDLPNDKLSRAMVKACLLVLKSKFQTPAVVVDDAVAAATAMTKVPGTWVRKGPHSAERPHRQTKIVYRPEPVEIAPVELVRDLALKVSDTRLQKHLGQPMTNGHAKPNPFRLTATTNERRAYGKAALNGVCARIQLAKPGPEEGRNNVLRDGAFRMGQLHEWSGVLQQEIESRLFEAAWGTGLPEAEIWDTLKRSFAAGKENPKVPEARPDPTAQPKIPAAAAVPEGDSIIVRASEINPQRIEWLWPGRIPLGKLVTFAGPGGLGKTFVLCDISARISVGGDWPDGKGECSEAGQVLFVSGEDDLDDTIVPRLIECGADLSKVAFLKTEVQDRFTLADLATLDKAVVQIGQRVLFVAIDPPTAYLGDVNDHKNAELRRLLTPLKSWASKHHLALVFNTHVTKPQGAKVEAMMRVMGSVAWVNAVRAAHLFAKDPDDQTRRLFVGMKMNVGKEKKGLAYRLVGTTGEMAKVEWLGEIETTADEAVNREPAKSRRQVASEWLIDRFREHSDWHSGELFAAGREANLSRNAIFEGKDKLGGVIHRKNVGRDGGTFWTWSVPPDWPPFELTRSTGLLDKLDKLDESSF